MLWVWAGYIYLEPFLTSLIFIQLVCILLPGTAICLKQLLYCTSILNLMECVPDLLLDMADLVAVSRCCPTSWKAVCELVAVVTEMKGSTAIGFYNEGVYVLTEWDVRDMAGQQGGG